MRLLILVLLFIQGGYATALVNALPFRKPSIEPVRIELSEHNSGDGIVIDMVIKNISDESVYVSNSSMCIDDSSYFSEWFIVKGRKNGKLVEYIEYTGLVVDELNSKSNYTALQAQQILKCSVILEHYYDLSAQYDSLLIQYYRKIFQ